jgi:hypothetical protein
MKSLTSDHMTNLFSEIDRVSVGMREVHFNQKMLKRKFESHYSSTEKHNKNITFMSIVETGLMSIILISQLFYIKSLVEQN